MPFTCHQVIYTIRKCTVAGFMYLGHTFEGFASFPISRELDEQR